LGATAQDPATQTISYTYDPASRITNMTTTGQPEEAYAYDSLNRLTNYTKGTEQATAYTYDADGNRVSQIITGRGQSRTAYAYAANSNRLQQTTVNTERPTDLTYDASGNMISDGNRDFTFDAKGRMESTFLHNDQRPATTYAVNGIGQRVEKSGNIPHISTGTILYVYDNAGHALGEYDAQGRTIEETVWLGDLPVAVMEPQGEDRNNPDPKNHRNNDTFYVASDQLGASRTITNATGNIVWQWLHAPFGNTPAYSTSRGGELVSTDLRFAGMVFDEESGLFQNGFRDSYNPNSGRYGESDPVGLAGGINTYQYALQNPLSYSDPTGKNPVLVLVGIGAFVGGVSGGITTGNAIGWSWNNAWKIAVGAGVGAGVGAFGSLSIGTDAFGLFTGMAIGGFAGAGGDMAGQAYTQYLQSSQACLVNPGINWGEVGMQGMLGMGAGAFSAIPTIAAGSGMTYMNGVYAGAYSFGMQTQISPNQGGFGWGSVGSSGSK
ncbi:MAG: RHS repeat-associated core domain-containing protein, partial [Alphaproteobacteria bacterium]